MNDNNGVAPLRTLLPLVMVLAAPIALSQAWAADLKQLAEQLVNLSAQKGEMTQRTGRNPQTGKEMRKGRGNPAGPVHGQTEIREGGRTVGAGQANAIAIKEEGANVKKEKGVEDVE